MRNPRVHLRNVDETTNKGASFAPPLFCDNSAAVSVARDSASAKRLPFVTRRIRLLHELHQRGIINVCEEGVPGTANPSDALTKHLSPKVFKAYMARLYNCLESAI